MIIAIEGCDGTGKTTLFNQLKRDSRFPYAYFLSTNSRLSEPEELRQYLNWISQFSEKNLIILDRFSPLSEMIYSNALGRVCLFPDVSALIPLLETAQICFVHCRPPLRIIEDNILNSPQKSGVLSHHKKIIALYDEWMGRLRHHNITVFEYDYYEEGSATHILSGLLEGVSG